MQTSVPHQVRKKINVAAYCRVSTDQDEQLSSYENQVNYYRDYISKHEDYELVDIYADEGISATNTKKRDAFNRLIQDCRAGKVDRILVKSISRFARNTLDCIKYVRELKELGVGVTFEKENIDSLDSKGEVLLTILSSLAQDESRSISENATWGIRKKFERGEVRVNTTKFMGYDKDDNGRLIINPQQAETVKFIYEKFLDGYSPESIAKYLNDNEIPGWTGKANWYPSAIQKMLQNEKYKGDALLQKTFTVDYLTKKRVQNDGQVNQYYVENSHEAIIDKDTWELVQLELARRKAFRVEHLLKSYIMQNDENPFTTKVFCAECGSAFGRKNWTTSRGKRKVWQCNNRYRIKEVEGCFSRHLDEVTLEQIFLKALVLLSENIDLLDGKWEKILAENRLLDKHYSMALSDILRKEQIAFNPSDMCRVLDFISIGFYGEITVCFLEGTEVDL
ncbi:recombinase family protein [Streptococcus suis]|uniref:recombinase family protein n=1 Tax=Streptococcus suis TaxID=1307 RepID=UPI0028AD8564|nr:recombinase family protein [Streptococcus suis]WNN11270.1 recombinase family protein [Streptococcus suis]WNO79747.1 recombinase family protein [Streptococcus suis]HEM4204741.1 recombinase family protein [Streptococcus suis]